MLKNTYPCAAVILKRAWRNEKEKKESMSFWRSRVSKKPTAAFSSKTLKLIFKRLGWSPMKAEYSEN